VIRLDTNHVSVLRMPSSERSTRLVERMTLSHDQQFGIPIVAVEETMRGWLAAIAKERLARRQVAAYRELSSLFAFFAPFLIAPFDQAAADQFDSLYAPRFELPRVI
jgi:tRNA(fMet)-specific endonuclease VapC